MEGTHWPALPDRRMYICDVGSSGTETSPTSLKSRAGEVIEGFILRVNVLSFD